MSDLEEAKLLLADLPIDDPFTALDEITGWLVSVKETPGFRPESRAGILMLLDETGQLFHQALLTRYLAESHLQDFQGLRLWKAMHGYSKALTNAYALCVSEFQQESSPASLFAEKIPIICVRLLRAITEQLKLELMRYINVGQAVWEQLYKYYNFAVANEFAESIVFPYSRRAVHSSPQRELLRAALLYAASPATLAPEQIETSYRIAAQLSSYFDFKETADQDCAYFLDLAKSTAPGDIHDKLQPTPSMRFFGATRAIPQLEALINDHKREVTEQDMDEKQKQSTDKNFIPQTKLTTLKHLKVYWGMDHPYRRQERRDIHTSIEVVYGFKVISNLVTIVELNKIANLEEKEKALLKEKTDVRLVEVRESISYIPETWDVLDVSVRGIGTTIPKTAGDWVKVGALCGLKASNSNTWWVGMIRRLKTDPKGNVQAGIEIIAKKPLSVWLRSLGRGAHVATNWESSSESFKYDYVPVIIVPDAQESYENGTLLMEAQEYLAERILEIMMGEKSGNIRLIGVLAEGADYVQISFEWLDSTATT